MWNNCFRWCNATQKLTFWLAAPNRHKRQNTSNYRSKYQKIQPKSLLLNGTSIILVASLCVGTYLSGFFRQDVKRPKKSALSAKSNSLWSIKINFLLVSIDVWHLTHICIHSSSIANFLLTTTIFAICM